MAKCDVRFSPAALAVFLLSLLSLTGCSHKRLCVPSEWNEPGALVPLEPTDDHDNHIPLDSEIFATFPQRLQATEPPQPPPAGPVKNALVLSGGGMYGAYAVGVLTGWSACGGRPTFDVVSGISTGALIATYAFLGAEYDQRLTDLYTNVRVRDIYHKRSVMAMLLRDAAATSRPLKRIIDRELDDQVLEAVASAHAAGRRLYVGTTDVDSGGFVVWDMGAIAASGRPDAKELYRKVVLASASIPGLLPPVEIPIEINGRRYSQMHVDGGAASTVFFRAEDFAFEKGATPAQRRQILRGANVYALVSGKLYPDPTCARRNALKIAESSLNTFYDSELRGDLFEIYALCLLNGMHFHLASTPQQLPVGSDSMNLKPAEMRRLYDCGFNLACNGKAWRHEMPMAEPNEYVRPRSGNEFIAPKAVSPTCAP